MTTDALERLARQRLRDGVAYWAVPLFLALEGCEPEVYWTWAAEVVEATKADLVPREDYDTSFHDEAIQGVLSGTLTSEEAWQLGRTVWNYGGELSPLNNVTHRLLAAYAHLRSEGTIMPPVLVIIFDVITLDCGLSAEVVIEPWRRWL